MKMEKKNGPQNALEGENILAANDTNVYAENVAHSVQPLLSLEALLIIN